MTTAVIASAAVGAGASLYGANKAAGAVKSSSNAAIGAEQGALAQQQKLMSPYTNLGNAAIPQLEALLGIGSGKGNTASALKALQNTPGYQFTQQQGNQATLNAATATGLLNSGNTLEALDKFNTGLADQTYQQAVNNARDATGIGANATAGVASNIGQTASQVGGQIVGAGNNLASLDANLAASLAGTAGNAANTYTLQKTLQGLNNPSGGVSDNIDPHMSLSYGGPTIPTLGDVNATQLNTPDSYAQYPTYQVQAPGVGAAPDANNILANG